MYIAFCDDEQDDLEALESLIQEWQQDRQISCRYKAFRSAAELLDAAKEENFTLYILDIIMSGTNGIATAKELRSIDTVADIVFLTSSTIFAYESYEVKALDYLLKPVSEENLFPLLDQIILREQRPQDGLTVKNGTTLMRILFSQLVFVEVNNKHLYFNLTNGQVLEVFGALKDYEHLLLNRPEFMHVHRSYIVNMLQVAEFSPAGIRTFSGKQIPVSRNLYSKLQKDYINLLFTQRKE